MEKLIGLHMDELLLINGKQTRSREIGKMFRGDGQGKRLAETQKQGIDLWRKKAEVERRGVCGKEAGKKEG